MKDQTIFVCSNCGNETIKWEGRCSVCQEWNTLREFKIQNSKFKIIENITPAEIVDLSQIKLDDFKRLKSGIGEFDRVLGGGIVPGSLILLAGDPGIGKSTLLLQVCENFENCLYVSGEESAQQLKLRHERLGFSNSNINEVESHNIKILNETDVDVILKNISELSPTLVVVDSIQTMYDQNFPSTPGSLVQVRETALKFQKFSKQTGISIILVGHITKEGTIAGPKTLEHLVDVVLYLEGERYLGTRILRTVKNRFGATSEIGVFEMSQNGMREVKNPSELFLGERLKNTSGSVVTATVEGTRPFLVEIQALCSRTFFGYPKRAASGFDLNRLQLLIAVLQNRAKINLGTVDIYVNVVSGVKIFEPACDLAVSLAIASSVKNKTLDQKLCAFGEVGLSGEIRKVNFEEKRKQEAKRLGFNKFNTSRTIADAVNSYLS